MRKLLIIYCLCVGGVPPAAAAIRTIALSNGDVPGVPGAKFASFSGATINSAGQVAFQATLLPGLGGITGANDAGLFRHAASNLSLVAQKGSGNVPGVAGASFETFSRFELDDNGTAYLQGRLALQDITITPNNRDGHWRFATGGNQLLARTASGDAQGITGSGFASFNPLLSISPNGKVVLSGPLQVVPQLVDSYYDTGMWQYDAGGGTLLLREGISLVPGVPGASFETFVRPVLNGSDQLAFRGVLDQKNGITSANYMGLWRYTYGIQGELLARTGIGNVPGMPGATFAQLGNPALNASGQVAFKAQLTNLDQGVWRCASAGDCQADAGVRLAITNGGNVPGIPGATFASFFVGSAFDEPFYYPQMDNTGRVIVRASLNLGLGGVTPDDAAGLWALDGPASGQLLLRTGIVGAVPGLPSARFSNLGNFTLHPGGTLAVQATLEPNFGGVGTSDNQGIWVLSANGSGQLVARTGQALAGRTIAALSFPPLDKYTAPGRRFTDQGALLFHADFTDGSSGLFVYEPELTYAADFDGDSDVDQGDLTLWQSAHGSTSQGDANADGVSDGTDFLIWQREYTGPGPQAAGVAVPEPSTLCLLAMVCLVAQQRVNSAASAEW